MPTNAWHRLIRIWPLLLACVLALLVLAFSNVRLIDDAYISFRYAHNLVEGEGLVFNPGEYVEGYTSLIWTLLMVVPEALGVPVHLFSAYLGMAFGLLALVDVWRICRSVGASLWGVSAAVIALGLYPAFWLTVTNGLEGGLFTFLLTRTVFLLLCERATYAGLFGGLLFMTRPESVLILPICALYRLFSPRNQTLPFRQRIVHCLIPLLAPWLALVLAVTLWRLAHYGAWLPNTITAKSIPLSALSFQRIGSNVYWGLSYFSGFLVSSAPFTVGAVLVLLVVEDRRRHVVWLLLGIVAIQLPIVLINGGDWIPYYRLLAVYTPLLTVALGLAVDRIVTIRETSGSIYLSARNKLVVSLLFAAGLVFMLLGVELWRPAPDADATGYPWQATPDFTIEKPEPCWQELADLSRPVLVPDDRISPEALGVFSYMFPDVYSHDFLGLTDKQVARYGTVYNPRYGKQAPAYTYYDVQPDLIVVHSGFGHLSPMARISDGAYNENYSTYRLTNLPRNCRGSNVVVSIQKASVTRILPAFTQLEPQPVTVPI